MNLKKAVFALVVVVVSIALIPMTLQLPSSQSVSTLIGPRVWPFAIIVLLILCGLWLLAKSLRDTLAERRAIASGTQAGTNAERTSTADTPPDSLDPEETAALTQPDGFAFRHWLLLALLCAYTFAVPLVGFIAATAGFALLCCLLLGQRSPLQVVAIPACLTVGFYVVFQMLLGIPLPTAELSFF